MLFNYRFFSFSFSHSFSLFTRFLTFHHRQLFQIFNLFQTVHQTHSFRSIVSLPAFVFIRTKSCLLHVFSFGLIIIHHHRSHAQTNLNLFHCSFVHFNLFHFQSLFFSCSPSSSLIFLFLALTSSSIPALISS